MVSTSQLLDHSEEPYDSDEDSPKEARETRYCIKGYDYLVTQSYNQHTLQALISENVYSSVQIVQENHSFKKYVMKQMAKGRMLRQNKEAYLNCMREKDIHKGLIHPNIIRMVEIIEDENDEDKLYLVMEFAENGQISVYDERSKKFWPPRTVGQSLSETEILQYATQLIDAIDYLHEKRSIMHLDIKPQNVLLDSYNQVKLADFGSSQKFYDGEDTIFPHKGTIYFMAPECFKQSGGTGGTRFYSGKAVDIWALGMTLFTLIFNELPFSLEGSDPRLEIPKIDFTPYFTIYEHETDPVPPPLPVPKLAKNLSSVPEESPAQEPESPQVEVKSLGEGLDSELKSTRDHEYKQHIPEDLQRFMLKMLVKEPSKRASIIDLKNDKWLNQH